MDFFEKLDQISPGYSNKIYQNFMEVLDGKCRNPFQYKATIWALETQFSKAVQKHDVTSGGKPIPIYGGLSSNNSDQKDIQPQEED